MIGHVIVYADWGLIESYVTYLIVLLGEIK